ncbi:response regulator transcription factor [Paenibacillus montanisoli]|uniref:response regulator transcription factor n=1 Tax=Paenibacillus montanisoli TaxID=2081970 RepID=UPI001403F52A|nr:response regulator transcription factor [Paenibacillus montanisoli]
MGHPIKVLLVEDDPFWRERLAEDLSKEPDIAVVMAAATKEEALQAGNSMDIDVVLMDINLTENQLDGLEITRELTLASKAAVKIIMLTSLTEREVIIKSFQNGAVNYINKSNFEDIAVAIREASSNLASIHPDAAFAMREEIRLMQLTPSEREIHDLKEKGFSRTEIAALLHKSMNTIKTQVRSIRNKLMK